jgi:3-hydroxyisobutyrate dehydrogenase
VFMVGCAAEDYAAVEHLFTPLARKTIRVGDVGTGQAAAICNSLALGISMLAASEALALAEKLGLDPGMFFEVASNASGGNSAMTERCPIAGIVPNVPSNRSYFGGQRVSLLLKDLALAKAAADDVGAQIPVGEKVRDLYARLDASGFGIRDFSCVYQLTRGQLGEM